MIEAVPLEPQQLVDMLPGNQKKYAIRKINAAIKWGWTQLDFYQSDYSRCNQADLVGVSPMSEFDFLPDPASDQT